MSDFDVETEALRFLNDVGSVLALGRCDYAEHLITLLKRCRNATVRETEEKYESMLAACPGCIKCGPPILVKAEDGCDGSGRRRRREEQG